MTMPWRGLGRLVVAIIGPPAVYAACFAAGYWGLPVQPSSLSWGDYVALPVMGVLVIGLGLLISGLAISALVAVVGGLAAYVEDGFDEDRKKAQMCSPDTPGVGALSDPEQADAGALSLPVRREDATDRDPDR